MTGKRHAVDKDRPSEYLRLVNEAMGTLIQHQEGRDRPAYRPTSSPKPGNLYLAPGAPSSLFPLLLMHLSRT